MAISKSEQKRIEEMRNARVKAVEKGSNMPKVKYGYICPACSQRAFYSANNAPFTTTTCMNCGKDITYDKTNFVLLKPQEARKVNAEL